MSIMSYDYSENILVQESAGSLLQNELGWDVQHIMRDDDTGDPIVRSHQELEREMILDYVKRKKLKAVGGQMENSLFLDFGDGYDKKQQRIDAYRMKNHEIGWIPEYDGNDDKEEY